MSADLRARGAAELVGTALLLATVVGSGIMAERLAGSAAAVALLCNALATGAGLVAILLALGPVSGAHLNPAVTLVAAFRGQLRWMDAPVYIAAQVAGAIAGVILAHAMFEEPLLSLSTHVRAGPGQLISELVATAGLLLVTRTRSEAEPFAVGAYITAAYWFTASTSFANPAVTIARCLTRTYAGIRPADAPGFLAAQAVGAAVGGALLSLFAARTRLDEEAVGSPEVAP